VSALRQLPRVTLVFIVLLFAAFTAVGSAAPAGAQASDQAPTLTDFCTNGVCDFAGYSAALAEFLNRNNGSGAQGATETAAGSLPVTGGDSGLLLGIGISLVLVGGTVVWTVNRRRTRLEGGL